MVEVAKTLDGNGRREVTDRLRLSFIAGGDPLDVRTWSGTPFHMHQALKRHFTIDVLRSPWPQWFELLRKVTRRLSGGRLDPRQSLVLSALGSRRALRRLEASDSDYAFVIGNTAISTHSWKVKPTIHVSDATFLAMEHYNPNFSQLMRGQRRVGERLETRAMLKAALSFLPSRWAIESAVEDHQVPEAKCRQIEWGANLVAPDIVEPEARDLSHWRLLFVGVDWVGKGGDVALSMVSQLRQSGINAALDVVGCQPSSPPPVIDGVTFHGFLSKNNDGQRTKLVSLFQQAHVFVLPTRFDAFPTVIAEAATFGLPAIAFKTGGLSTNVVHGKTGLLIDPSGTPDDFAAQAKALLSDRQRYVDMCHEALRFSRDVLSWTVWADRVASEILSARRDARGDPE